MKAEHLNLLSLAKKGRLLELGEEPVGAACRAGHARLILVAQDAAEHSFRRAQHFSSYSKCPVLRLSCSKDELGACFGRANCAMAALTDAPFAWRFASALPAGEVDAEILAQLQAGAEKVQKLRAEAKAHKRNLRNGKK